jgi:predicted secreted protein
MGWVTGTVVYLLVWWILLFAILPWGAAPPEHPEPGMESGAPARPRMPLKFAITTVLAGVIWLGIYAFMEADIISFRDLARGMSR